MAGDAPDAGRKQTFNIKELAEPLQSIDVDDVQAKIEDGIKNKIGGADDPDEFAARKLLVVQVVTGIVCLGIAIIFAVISRGGSSAQLLGAPDSLDSSDDKPRLVYIKAFGHAEVVRLAFRLGGIDFNNYEIEKEKWAAILNDPAPLPEGFFDKAERAFKVTGIVSPIPVLTHGDFRLAGTLACAQYAADLGINAYRRPSAQQRSLDAMMVSAHSELLDLLAVDPAAAEGIAAGDKFCKKLEHIEGFYKDTAQISGVTSVYLYGAWPSLGDLAIFAALSTGPPQWHEPKEYLCFKQQLEDKQWKSYPHLQAMFEAVMQHDRLRPYLEARATWQAAER